MHGKNVVIAFQNCDTTFTTTFTTMKRIASRKNGNPFVCIVRLEISLRIGGYSVAAASCAAALALFAMSNKSWSVAPEESRWLKALSVALADPPPVADNAASAYSPPTPAVSVMSGVRKCVCIHMPKRRCTNAAHGATASASIANAVPYLGGRRHTLRRNLLSKKPMARQKNDANA